MNNVDIGVYHAPNYDDEILKKLIGDKVFEYRKKVMHLSREKFVKLLECRENTVANVERGKSFPNIDFLAKLADVSLRPAYTFIGDREFKISINLESMKLLEGLDDNEKMVVLIKSICERYELFSIYDKNVLLKLFDEKLRYTQSVVGYMIRFYREVNNIGLSRFAKDMGYTEKRVMNSESGNSIYSFKKLYDVCIYLDVPIDVLIVGHLNHKNFVIHYLMSKLFENVTQTDKEFIENYIIATKKRYMAKRDRKTGILISGQ